MDLVGSLPRGLEVFEVLPESPVVPPSFWTTGQTALAPAFAEGRMFSFSSSVGTNCLKRGSFCSVSSKPTKSEICSGMNCPPIGEKIAVKSSMVTIVWAFMVIPRINVEQSLPYQGEAQRLKVKANPRK